MIQSQHSVYPSPMRHSQPHGTPSRNPTPTHGSSSAAVASSIGPKPILPPLRSQFGQLFVTSNHGSSQTLSRTPSPLPPSASGQVHGQHAQQAATQQQRQREADTQKRYVSQQTHQPAQIQSFSGETMSRDCHTPAHSPAMNRGLPHSVNVNNNQPSPQPQPSHLLVDTTRNDGILPRPLLPIPQEAKSEGEIGSALLIAPRVRTLAASFERISLHGQPRIAVRTTAGNGLWPLGGVAEILATHPRSSPGRGDGHELEILFADGFLRVAAAPDSVVQALQYCAGIDAPPSPPQTKPSSAMKPQRTNLPPPPAPEFVLYPPGHSHTKSPSLNPIIAQQRVSSSPAPAPAHPQSQSNSSAPTPQAPPSSTNSPFERRCYHCNTRTTPMWRRGPTGSGTLCNRCGVRWKKGSMQTEQQLKDDANSDGGESGRKRKRVSISSSGSSTGVAPSQPAYKTGGIVNLFKSKKFRSLPKKMDDDDSGDEEYEASGQRV